MPWVLCWGTSVTLDDSTWSLFESYDRAMVAQHTCKCLFSKSDATDL
jgi:hypothetical protein